MLPKVVQMRKLALFCIFLILWLHSAVAESIITIEVLENGDALWVVEKHLPFTTQSEINEWEGFIKSGNIYLYRRDIKEFNDRINVSLHSAENYTNRSMKTENFNISYDTATTMSNAFGIIRYSFEWKNFSRKDPDKIFIGDTFSEGMVLSSDNVLIIKIPDGYEVKSVSPNFDKRDGNRLIWDGTTYRNFDKGEPALVLLRTGKSLAIWPITWPIVAAFVVLISGGLVILWKIRRGGGAYKAGSDADMSSGIDGVPVYSEEKDTQPYKAENVMTALPELTEVDLLDEEMIEKFLIKSGGQTYQSDIVKEIGYSKSKISIVLAGMKEEGRILKIKKGKENLIRLVRK